MFNSFPYLILFGFFLVLYLIEDTYKNDVSVRNKVRFFCGTAFVIFFGFRGYIGSDWLNYEYSYSITSWKEWTINDYEIGYSAIAKTFAFFKISYFYFVAFITTLQVFLLDRFLSKYPKFSVSIFYIALIALFPVLIVDLQRNFLSILLVMNGIALINSGNKKGFYLYVGAGMLFHLSAIVFFILPYLDRIKFKKGLLLVLFILGLIIYALQINFYKSALSILASAVGGRLEHLIEQSTGETEVAYGLTIGIVEKIFLYILIFNIYTKISKEYRLIVNACIVYLLIYFYFSTSQSFINRFANLFFWGYILSYDQLRTYLMRLKLKPIFVFCFLTFCFLRTYVGYNSILYRYTNILVQEEDKTLRIYDRNAFYFGR
ncbi:EpsG family protein [Sphingobacterium sp. UBA5670]|uniref:EpsG family protein n=1 Tax=Sphingobacterium sp. UBA5670 TaxID=1947502 RepID=UPI0025EF437D|nr:EpsG family protein [Sphingobacterium sp. UBA5670]